MVWIPLRFQTNHSKTSIILVPTILIVLFRLGEAGVSTDQKKSLLILPAQTLVSQQVPCLGVTEYVEKGQ